MSSSGAGLRPAARNSSSGLHLDRGRLSTAICCTQPRLRLRKAKEAHRCRNFMHGPGRMFVALPGDWPGRRGSTSKSLESASAPLSGLRRQRGLRHHDISGSGVTVSQVATDPSGNTYVIGQLHREYHGLRLNSGTTTFPDQTSNPKRSVVSYFRDRAVLIGTTNLKTAATKGNPTRRRSRVARQSRLRCRQSSTVYVVG